MKFSIFIATIFLPLAIHPASSYSITLNTMYQVNQKKTTSGDLIAVQCNGSVYIGTDTTNVIHEEAINKILFKSMSKNAILEFSLFGNAKSIPPDDTIITFHRGTWKKQSPFIYHPLYKTKVTYREDLEENLDRKLTATTYEMKKQEKGRVSYSKLASTPNLHAGASKDETAQKADTQVPTGKKKRICRMLFTFKKCRNGDNCPWAHDLKELDGEYKPNVWVSYFTQNQNLQNIPRAMPGSTKQGNFAPNRGSGRFFAETAKNSGADQLNSPQKAFDFERFTKTSLWKKNAGKAKIVNINKIVNTKGKSLLLEAASTNNYNGIEEMLSSGANPMQKDWKGFNSLIYAIKNNNLRVLELLIQNSQYDINIDETFTSARFTYLILAAQIPNPRMIKYLLDKKADPNIADKNIQSPLFYCVANNCLEGCEYLLQAGADVNLTNKDNKKCLDIAYKEKMLDVFDILVENGGQMNDLKRSKKLLLFACAYNMNSIGSLLNKVPIAETDKNGNNLLMVAFLNGNIELCKHLIKKYGINSIVNNQNKKGENVLIKSIKDRNENFAEFLLTYPEIELDLQVKDKDKKDALILACEEGLYKIVTLILQKGGDPNSEDMYGRTPLIMACKGNHILTVEALLKARVSTTWTDKLHNMAEDYTTNPTIKSLIKYYQLETGQITESLAKELENERFDYRKSVF